MEILRHAGLRQLFLCVAFLLVAGATDRAEAAAGSSCLAPSDTQPVQLSAHTLDKEPSDLADLRGKPVLVDVWATWCSACRETLVAANNLAAETPDTELAVIGLSVDRDPQDARIWLQETLANQSLIAWQANPSETFAALDVRALPATVLLDANGRVLARHEGSDKAELESLLARARECRKTSG